MVSVTLWGAVLGAAGMLTLQGVSLYWAWKTSRARDLLTDLLTEVRALHRTLKQGQKRNTRRLT